MFQGGCTPGTPPALGGFQGLSVSTRDVVGVFVILASLVGVAVSYRVAFFKKQLY